MDLLIELPSIFRFGFNAVPSQQIHFSGFLWYIYKMQLLRLSVWFGIKIFVTQKIQIIILLLVAQWSHRKLLCTGRFCGLAFSFCVLLYLFLWYFSLVYLWPLNIYFWYNCPMVFGKCSLWARLFFMCQYWYLLYYESINRKPRCVVCVCACTYNEERKQKWLVQRWLVTEPFHDRLLDFLRFFVYII